jgi:uncharacterized protein (TIGR02284 family)
VQSPDIRALCHEISQQRAVMAGELQKLARSLGEPEPEDSPSLAGTLHRGWINLKAAITSRDEAAVLAECERGEDTAVADFKKALDSEELPVQARSVVQAQFSSVKAAHDRVKALRDKYAAAKK